MATDEERATLARRIKEYAAGSATLAPTEGDRAELADKIKQAMGTYSAPSVGAGFTAIGRSEPVRWSLSALGKTLDVLDTGLNAVTLGLRPVVTALDPALNEVYDKEGWNITPSSLIEEAMPGKSIGKKLLKFIADVALDPLTYTGVGLTKTGTVLAKAGGLARAGEDIAAGSKLGKDIIRSGMSFTEAKMGLPATMAEQARLGYRAAVKFAGIPIIKGEAFYGVMDRAKAFTQYNKYSSAIRKTFSTLTGNENFDEWERDMINILQYKKGQAIGSAKAIDDAFANVALHTGMTRDQVNNIATEMLGRPTRLQKAVKKVVTRIAPDATRTKDELVAAFKAIGQTETAASLEKVSVFSKGFKDLEKSLTPEAKVRLLEEGKIIKALREEITNPMKQMIEDVSWYNKSRAGKMQFAKGVEDAINHGVGDLRLPIPDLDLVEVNPHSKYLRGAYKEGRGITGIRETASQTILADLEAHKVTLRDVVDDLFRPIEVKPPTTRVQLPSTLQKEIRGRKLEKKLARAGYDTTITTPERVVEYYRDHYFRPRILTSSIDTTTSQPIERALRKGQLIDMLKESRGDVYDKSARLINRGIIENRDILPFGHGLDSIVRYDEREVIVKTRKEFGASYDTIIVPRSEFEKEVSEVKALVYDTGQILPVVHNTPAIDKILEEGFLRPGASMGSGTQARDYAAGLKSTVFASAPESSGFFGRTSIILPVDVLQKTTSLPGDGLNFPANPFITRHLLSKGQDGLLDLAIRHIALRDWESLGDLKKALMKETPLKSALAETLSETHFTPDIHLTGPIHVSQFLGIMPLAALSVRRLAERGIDVEKLQLIDRNGRFLMRVYGKAGVPLVDQELLAAPNLAEILSKSNIAGVAVDAERKAAGIEAFMAKVKIPEGESVYTYLRKVHPDLLNPEIKALDRPEYLETLDNYGLLSDESIESLGANILKVREGLLGEGLTARQVLSTPAGVQARTDIIINNQALSESVKKIPGYQALPDEEKGKIFQQVIRGVKAHERGHNVFTMSLRILPDELQYGISDVIARATDLSLVRMGEGGKVLKDNKFSEVLKAYTSKGEDAAIAKLIGRKQLEKIKKNPLEYEHMKSVVKKMVAHVDELFADAHSIYMMNPAKLHKIWPELATEIKKIYSRKGWKTEWVVENTQVPNRLAIKYPEIYDIVQGTRRLEHEMVEREVNAGVHVGTFTGSLGAIKFAIMPEVKKHLLATYFKGAKKWTETHQQKILDEFRRVNKAGVTQAVADKVITRDEAQVLLKKKGGLRVLDKMVKEGKISRENAGKMVYWHTIENVNYMTNKGTLKLLGGKSFPQFFDPNPANQIKVRGIEGARAATSHEYFQGVKEWGIFSQNVPVGSRYTRVPALKGWSFPDEIADHIDRFYGNAQIPADMHPFVDLFDTLQDTWKAWTLAIFPAYHTRNIVGNVWNNFLAGVINPVLYQRAWDITWDAHNGRNLGRTVVHTGFGKDYTLGELIDLMKRHDIWRVGQYGRDVEHLMEKDMKGALGFLRDNKLLNTGRNVGTTLETQAYIAHFLHRLEQGWSPGAAAQSVKKYLFDYGDLTDFERNVMKRVFPFYTWTRKNIPLQLEALVTQPGKPLSVLKIKNAYETNYDGVPDERYLPDWFVQNFPIRARLNKSTGNHEYFMLGSWLPLADIDKLFYPTRLVSNMLSPLLKEPIQQVANRDFLSGREIDKGDEYERLATVNMPKRVAHVMKNVRLISEMDRLTKKDTSFESKVLGLATGKLYPYDEAQARQFEQKAFHEKERNLTSQLNRARAKGDIGEMNRVIKTIREAKKRRVEKLKR